MHELVNLETALEKRMQTCTSFPLLFFVSNHEVYLSMRILSLFLSEFTYNRLSLLTIQLHFVLKIIIDEDLRKKKKDERQLSTVVKRVGSGVISPGCENWLIPVLAL